MWFGDKLKFEGLGAALALIGVVFVLVASVFIWSGAYNIAAGQQHWSITNWLLTIVRDQSIRTYSQAIQPPNLQDPAKIALGAEHYKGGCALCHGEPGRERSPIMTRMLPEPPDLTAAAGDYRPQELYWIIRNGLKFTGMPAWPAPYRDDEVWSVVAFLVHLHRNGPEAYAELVSPTDKQPLVVCARCHSADGSQPVSSLVPVLAGQSETYLQRSMEEYAANARESGIMEPVIHALDPGEIEALANYYADLTPKPLPVLAPDADAVARGHEIATKGVPESGIPACSSCHSAHPRPGFPSLAGQPADYLQAQLEIWRDGHRDGTPHGAIMAVIGKRLTFAQAADVSEYYQSLEPVK